MYTREQRTSDKEPRQQEVLTVPTDILSPWEKNVRRLKSLERSNAETYKDILKALGEITEVKTKLSEDIKKADPLTRPAMIAKRQAILAEEQSLLRENPAYKEAVQTSELWRKSIDAIATIEDPIQKDVCADLIEFAFTRLPPNIHARYVTRFEQSTNQKLNGAERYTYTQGTILELTRLKEAVNNPEALVLFDLPSIGKITYQPVSDTSPKTTEALRAEDFDLLTQRQDKEGATHTGIVETKYSPRRLFGKELKDRDQLIRFNELVKQGKMGSASVEITGRVDPDFLSWAIGSGIGDAGALPHVELIYTMQLPSGADYRLVIKDAKNGHGASFKNEDRTYTKEDLQVISGLRRSLLDRSFINILEGRVLPTRAEDLFLPEALSGITPDEAQAIRKKVIAGAADPFTSLTTREEFLVYEANRQREIYTRLINKRELINTRNELAAYRFETDEAAERAAREIFLGYQTMLKHNERLASIKQAYVVSETQYETVISLMVERISRLRAGERTRAEKEAREPVTRTGYKGPKEGLALDLEHVMLDAIQEIQSKSGGKSRGRSYEDAEQKYFTPEKLLEFLSDPNLNRRHSMVEVYDPLLKTAEGAEGKLSKDPVFTIEKPSIEVQEDIARENIKRSMEKLEIFQRDVLELQLKESRNIEEEGQLRVAKSLIARYTKNESLVSGHTTRINRLQTQKKERVDVLNAERARIVEPLAAAKKAKLPKGEIAAIQADVKIHQDELNQRLRATDEEFKAKIRAERFGLESLYRTIFTDRVWNDFAQHVQKASEQNILKLIYVVRGDEKVLFDEEKVRAEVTGRAAHSEPAEGQNVYGAGEIAFEKTGTGEWVAVELNNGSGHFRPSAETLPYVRAQMDRVFQGKIDLSRMKLKDTLLRGAELPPEMDTIE